MLDIQAEQHAHGQPHQELYEAVLELKRRHDLHPCSVGPRDGLALRADHERDTVQDLVTRFRRLPEDQRRRLPALWNSLAQLEIVVGDLEAGLNDFQEVARLVSDPISRAEAHHNVYRAALERQDHDTALAALRRASALDPEAFEPFPFSRYEPRAILQGVGVGSRFLCHDLEQKHEVIVQTLRADVLDRHPDQIIRDARAMTDLDHPALVRVLGSGYGGAESARPYLVLEHAPGVTLDELIDDRGPLSPEEWFQIAWPLARTLHAIHNRGLLHRCLHPSCLFVDRTASLDGRPRLRLKIAGAGLAIKRAFLHSCASHPDALAQTALGRSVRHVLPYLPQEIVGRPKGQVWIGPHSDIYSFGKLCALALTGRPDPDRADRLLLTEAWSKLISDCTAWTINQRPAHLGLIVDRLSPMAGDGVISAIERDLYESTVVACTRAIEANPDSAIGHINRSNAHARQGDLLAAIADLDRALRLEPDNADLFRRRAALHSRNNDHQRAIADYSESLRLEPRNLDALTGRGNAHVQRGNLDQAIDDFTEALRLEPRDEHLLSSRATARHNRGDLERAIADYTELLRLNPRHVWALSGRGRAHGQRGDEERAHADFTRLLQIDPTNVRALCDRATAHTLLGRHDRAIADYTEAIRLEATPGLYIDRGRAYFAAGKMGEAVADFSFVLEQNPDNAAVQMMRGEALVALGKAQEALADLDQVIRTHPTAVAFVARGQAQAQLKLHDQAVADYSEALKLVPEQVDAFLGRAAAFVHLGNDDAAIADYSEVIRLDALHAEAHARRGECRARQGDWSSAVEDLDLAADLEPEEMSTFLARSEVLTRLNRIDEALNDLNRVVEMDEECVAALHARGLLLARRGETVGALDSFAAVLSLDSSHVRALVARANLNASLNRRELALSDYSAALDADPGYAPALINRGLLLAQMGNHEAALADLNKALEIRPKHPATLVNRGLTRRHLGDPEGALADFSAAIQIEPGNVLALYNRAATLTGMNRFDEALADYDRALTFDPEDASIYLARGRVHHRRGNHSAALADHEEALRRSPDDISVCNNLAWILATCPEEASRNPSRALDLAARVIGIGGKPESRHLDTLAAAQAANGNLAEALTTMRKALESATERDRAEMEQRLRCYESGQAWFEGRLET